METGASIHEISRKLRLRQDLEFGVQEGSAELSLIANSGSDRSVSGVLLKPPIIPYPDFRVQSRQKDGGQGPANTINLF